MGRPTCWWTRTVKVVVLEAPWLAMAHRTTSEGVGLPYILRRRGQAPQIPPRGLVSWSHAELNSPIPLRF